MTWKEQLGNLFVEQRLSGPAKKYKENRRKAESLADKEPSKAYPHFLSARYYKNKIKKNPERVKVRGR